MPRLIDSNIVRALERIQKDDTAIDFLVEEGYKDRVRKLFTKAKVEKSIEFDLKTEFMIQYNIVKTAINNIGNLQSKEDIDILKEAQKFLVFILRNEEKLNDINAVKAFKEAVLGALDAESAELKDRVIQRLAGA